MFKAALTGTGEYLCTDIIMYKGNDEDLIDYSHAVYYNVLEGTLIDNKEKSKIDIEKYIPSKDCNNFVDYIEANNTHTVYVPCILHYQKIMHNTRELGLIGTIDAYKTKSKQRINFIKNEVLRYNEKWYYNKCIKYIHELEHY